MLNPGQEGRLLGGYEIVAPFKPLEDFDKQSSLDDWVKETQMPLIRFCRQFVGDWAEAEDMAQETYIRAWQRRNSFKGKASLLTWHMAIARRVCLDHLRRIQREKRRSIDENCLTHACDVETKVDVHNALAKLCADDRAILYLRTGEELSFDEIAQVLGKPPATCRKRYERAKQRFKVVYNDGEDE